MTRYKLLRMMVSKSGNPLYAGVYDEKQLPDKIRKNREICLPLVEVEEYRKPQRKLDKDIKIKERDHDVIIQQEEVTNVRKEIEKETKININTAKPEELLSVPGIGQKTTDLIILNRPYKEVGDIASVIKNMDRIDLDLLTV